MTPKTRKSDSQPSPAPQTRAQRETQSAAERLAGQTKEALQAVAAGDGTDPGELEASAARIERAARDLAVALRELAREHRMKQANQD